MAKKEQMKENDLYENVKKMFGLPQVFLSFQDDLPVKAAVRLYSLSERKSFSEVMRIFTHEGLSNHGVIIPTLEESMIIISAMKRGE